MVMDFNTAEPQTNSFDLIPDNTVAKVIMTVRPGGSGDGGWLKPTKDGSGLMLDAEFTVSEGPFAKRKLWRLFIVQGNGSEGHTKAENISRSQLRAIIESARGIKPDDATEAAKAKRVLKGYGDFDGVEFTALIGIEKGTGNYSDKNSLKAVIVPGDKRYGAAVAQSAQAPSPAAYQAAKSGNAAKPAWAQ